MVEDMTGLVVILVIGLAVCLIGWLDPKFDTASINGETPKILMWYTPLTKPTKRKYIMLWDYGWFKKR